MNILFAQNLSRLRRDKGLSQRQVSQDLGISQALLSHYENGVREPGLAFVVRACDYYQVSADDLLGRPKTDRQEEGAQAQRDPGALIQTADIIGRACVDLCQKEPELGVLFRRLAGQLNKQLGKE